jgi:hypothetical protein
VKAGEGHPACPAWEDEPFGSYLERYAKKLGLPVESDPFRREWPRDGRSQEERIDAIFRGERDEQREPGVDG